MRRTFLALAAVAALCSTATPASAQYLKGPEFNIGTSGLAASSNIPEDPNLAIYLGGTHASCMFEVVGASDFGGSAVVTVVAEATVYNGTGQSVDHAPVSTGVTCTLKDDQGTVLFSSSRALPGSAAALADRTNIPFWRLAVCVSATVHHGDNDVTELGEHCIAPPDPS